LVRIIRGVLQLSAGYLLQWILSGSTSTDASTNTSTDASTNTSTDARTYTSTYSCTYTSTNPSPHHSVMVNDCSGTGLQQLGINPNRKCKR
jgi:hypothetical protein